MLKFIIGGLAALTLSVSVQAQDVDQERLELAREMIVLSGAEAASVQAMELMLPTMRPLIEAQFPGASVGQYDAAMGILNEALTGASPQIAELSAEIYARRFTVDELRAFNTFYRSDAGRKLVEEQPAMLLEISRASEQIGVQAVTAVSDQIDAIFRD